MIIRFSCGIVKADHKSIFLSKSCEIIFMEISHIFTQYFHLSSRVISAHRMSCWKILFLFKVTVVLWLMHETRNHHPTCGWPASSQWPKPKTEFLGTLLPLFSNQSSTRQGRGDEGPAANGLLTAHFSRTCFCISRLTSQDEDGYFRLWQLKWTHC